MVVLVMPVVSQAADAFLCITEQSTGFAFDKARQQWRIAQFAPGKKFVIRRVTKDTVQEFPNGSRIPLSGAAWAVWAFGNDKIAYATCARDFSDFGMLFCEDSMTTHTEFNKKTGRFINGTLYGYVQGAIHAPAIMPGEAPVDMPEGSNTPYMEIGTCSTIS
jgi:hypothetical protein